MTETKMTDKDQLLGRVFNIQRYSIHDGPGIRTTVFLQGCPLKCAWCHNPEGLDSNPSLSFLPADCVGCGRCFKACPNGAHQLLNDRHVIERTACQVCGACVRECCSEALSLVGYETTVADVLEEVLSDKPFYESSNGGMTLSGGEPLAQIDFTEALLREAKSEGLHICCDTSGHAEWSSIKRIVKYVDLFLFDLKSVNLEQHALNTGHDNKLIMDNLEKLYKEGARIRIRIPLVPGYNDTEEDLEDLVDVLTGYPKIEAVELMPYHELGMSKRVRFGMDGAIQVSIKPPSKESLRYWAARLGKSGLDILNPME